MDEIIGEVDHTGDDRSSRSIYAALSTICVAYFFAFICYSGTDGLQTASDGDLPRFFVTAVICITSMVSSILLAPVFVSRLSANMALCVAWGSHALYAMASLYPTLGTLLPTALVVGATFPAVAVAQGVYTTALVDKWCERHGAGASGEEDRPRNRQNSGCTRCTTDESLRRENVFVFFNSILMACMAAGSLCGIIITPLLIGIAGDEEVTPATLLATAAAINSSMNSSNASPFTTTTYNTLSTTRITTTSVDELVRDSNSCGVNKCPYVDHPFIGRAKSSPSTWHALIFVLFCIAVSVVLTALLPSLLSANVYRSTPSAAALPVLRRQATPLDDSEHHDGYRIVGPSTRSTQSVRQKMLTTLYLFGDRRLLLLVPTIIVTGLCGSFTVAAFHQSFAGCDTSMIGQGTAYQRGAFGITTLLTGQLMILFIRRRTIVIVVLLAAVFVVAGTFTWSTSSSDKDVTLIVVWCLMNGAVAGVLRAAVVGIYPTLFGRGRLDSVLLHANLWDSVGATLSVLVADWLCLVIRAWLVIFAAGLAAVGYAGLECTCTYDRSDSSSGISGGSDVAEAQAADRESLASVCISPSETGSLSTVSSNRFNVVLRPSASRAYYTFDTSRPAY